MLETFACIYMVFLFYISTPIRVVIPERHLFLTSAKRELKGNRKSMASLRLLFYSSCITEAKIKEKNDFWEAVKRAEQ